MASVREVIEAAGAWTRYLASSRPGFDLIERAFANRKAGLHAAATRTIPDLQAEIRQAFVRFSFLECRNDLGVAG